MNLDMTMFHQAFFEEAADLLSDFERLLLKLEESPDDAEILNTIFRCAHSIKGSGATFGFTDVAHFTHGVETLLDRVRNHQVEVSHALVQLLLESLDQMQALMAVARGESGEAPNDAALLARITAAADGSLDSSALDADANDAEQQACDHSPQSASYSGTCIYDIAIRPGPETLRRGNDPARMIAELLDSGSASSVEFDGSNIPPLDEMDPETSYAAWRVQLTSESTPEALAAVFDFIAEDSEISIVPVAPDVRAAATEQIAVATKPLELVSTGSPDRPNGAQVSEGGSLSPTAPAASAETHTLRVSTEKVDKLVNLVGELVINQSMLNEVVQDFSMAKLPRLMEAIEANERASRELQERVMGIRMLPIKHAFGRFPRLVRDMASVIGKKIDLQMVGEETELDKGIIETIGDPLTHLVRNSIDHGLETPSERRAAGKHETGVICLNAFHEGGSIVIEISDDGRGLDREAILRKAHERGMVSDTDNLSDEAIYSFIFQAGFSTAAAVTDLSGRGVGMDIVRKAIQSLGGSISLNSSPGNGTKVRIRLPLTMAILEGLSLGVGGETYVVPLTSIIESIQPKASDVRRIAGKAEVVTVRESVLPILRLHEAFNIVPRVTDPSQGLLVIVENDGHKAGLFVDEIIGQSQVVIKSLEANHKKVIGIAGATILGNGRVALILDIPSLLREAGTGDAAPLPSAA